jgi:hypothetical protein
LANIYLHFALDLWFEKVVKRYCTGEVMLVRYADDFVCAFRYHDDAKRFYQELPERLLKFNLEVAPEKTHMMRFSRFEPSMQRRIVFLGFEIYWFYDRRGKSCVMQRTARKKLHGACKRIKDWIRENRHMKGLHFITTLNRRLQGHYNYYGLEKHEIFDAIKLGKLQYKENYAHGNPYYRLLREEVKTLVVELRGDKFFEKQEIEFQIKKATKEINSCKRKLKSKDKEKTMLIKKLDELEN